MEKYQPHKNYDKDPLNGQPGSKLLDQWVKEKQCATLPEDRFNFMWESALNRYRKIRKMSWIYTASAAMIAIFTSMFIIQSIESSQQELEQQYRQGAMALYEVSYYLNSGMEKLTPVGEIAEQTTKLEKLSQPIMKLNKLEPINQIPLKK